MKEKIPVNINKINRLFWSKNITDDKNCENGLLQEPEQVILNKIRKEIEGKWILDIGIGTGRTIPFLKEMSNYYVGIDYSVKLVNKCRHNYPGFDYICCDAQNLNMFRNEFFDFILFSFNGIDYSSHEKRLEILREIYRVLKKGGCFAFSSHNKDWSNSGKFMIERSFFSINPIQLVKNIQLFLHEFNNHLKNKKFEKHTEEYSIVNDSAHNYSLLTYYISIQFQIKQLIGIGFRAPLSILNIEGQEVAYDETSPWVYYLVKK